MSMPIEALKDMAQRSLNRQYGETQGKAIGFLLFGKTNLVPGLVNGAELIAKTGNIDAANEYAEDTVAGIAKEVAKEAVTSGIMATADHILGVGKMAGEVAEDIASSTVLVAAGLLSPSAIGPEPINPNLPINSGGHTYQPGPGEGNVSLPGVGIPGGTFYEGPDDPNTPVPSTDGPGDPFPKDRRIYKQV